MKALRSEDIHPQPAQILPHRPPMLMLDSLLQVESSRATAEKTFRPGEYGLDGDRVLAGALIECLAQAVAVVQGFVDVKGDRPPGQGMLVGIEDFQVLAPATAGCRLEIAVEIARRLGPFCMAEGTVSQEGAIIAKGTLKFYIEDEAGDALETR